MSKRAAEGGRVASMTARPPVRRSTRPRSAVLGAAVALLGALTAATTGLAAGPRHGGTYRGPSLSATVSLSGTLTVSGDGRHVKTMRLLFLTKPCPAAPIHHATALPGSGIAISGGRFKISGTVRSYAESGLRGPAATTVRGAFAPDGRSVAVSLRQVITYPPNTKGCALQTIVAHGTFALAHG